MKDDSYLDQNKNYENICQKQSKYFNLKSKRTRKSGLYL